MKSTHKVQRFNYKKIEQDGNSGNRLEYFGVHKRNGRLHIDTKRFKKMFLRYDSKEFLKEGMFKNRTTTYLIPKKVHRHDYKVNIIRDLLSDLNTDWYNEFKPVLRKIKTPEEVSENYRLDMISTTACSDVFDEIEMESKLKAMKRLSKYESVIQSLYCQFICKICAEIDRFTLILVKSLGYDKNRFDMAELTKFTDDLKHQTGAQLIEKLSEFSSFDMLHKINNFLKHNTLYAYNILKKKYPRNVKDKIKDKPYENGMFAGNWIIVEDDYIDKLFTKLKKFFEDYCHSILGEDLEESEWNYDDYFIQSVKNLRRKCYSI